MVCLPYNFIQSEVSIHPTCNNLICQGTGLNVGGKRVLQQCFERIFFAVALQMKGWKQRQQLLSYSQLESHRTEKKKVKLSSNLRYVFFFFSKMLCACEIDDFGEIKHLVPAALKKSNNQFHKTSYLRCIM